MPVQPSAPADTRPLLVFFTSTKSGPARRMESLVAHIARDPLDPFFSESRWIQRMRRSQSALKRTLLDQTMVSGVGNIYADESLWRARLSGQRIASTLRPIDLRRLMGHVRDVLSESLTQGGTSFDALYVNVNGQSGYFDRSLAVYGRECDFLLEEGATPWQIDRALQAFGFPMGLYLMRDMSGLDVGWGIRKYREQFRGKSLRYSPIADRLCELGRFGQKSGKGYYLYEGQGAAAKATPDPEVEALIACTAQQLGIQRRTVTDGDVVDRVLIAMVNAGARILEEGVALRAGDIDVTYIYGYGFPRHHGGPMFWGERRGLGWVLEQVRRQQALQGKFWEPAAFLVQAAARGRWSE